MKDLKSLSHYLISQIISDEGCIITETVTPDNVVRLTATVPAAELGKVIGKNGRIIQSVRTLLSLAATAQNKKVFLTLVGPAGSEGSSEPEESK